MSKRGIAAWQRDQKRIHRPPARKVVYYFPPVETSRGWYLTLGLVGLGWMLCMVLRGLS